MIRFALTCAQDHRFDSWFQSGDAFDRLKTTAQVICPICGSADVTKSLMSPNVTTAETQGARGQPVRATLPAVGSDKVRPELSAQPLSAPGTDLERAFAQLRREVEANSEYVGLNFAQEARAIHDGDAPQRAIYGEARHDEARKLVEDGVPVAPLPFIPARKSN
jgi:hypothetical protein